MVSEHDPMKLFSAGVCFLVVFLLSSCTPPAGKETLPVETNFDMRYRLILDEPGFTRVWIPIPESNDYQTISRLEIHTSLNMYLGRDKLYGNKFIIIEDRVRNRDTVSISFRCERRVAGPRNETLENTMREFYLAPNHSEPYDEQWDLVCDSLDAEREAFQYRLYNFLIATLSPASDPASDIVQAYIQGRGTVHEYAAIFAAISRTKGIPARYLGGLVLPNRPEGRIRGESAWNEFYLPRKGWVPVDLYQGDKEQRGGNTYFGTLDSRRIQFTVGRDIILPNGSPEDVADHSVFPYVKVSGRVLSQPNLEITYTEIQ